MPSFRIHRVVFIVVAIVAVIQIIPRHRPNTTNDYLVTKTTSTTLYNPHHTPAAAAVVSASSAATTTTFFDLETFLSTFQAANPNYTEDCIAYLRSPQEYNRKRNDVINWRWHFSQYNQDWFMFVHYFYQYALTGKKGFYVESGTNDWIRVSNTALYDLCLGWNGICVEPERMYHGNITQRRSCHLETKCLSDKTERIKIAYEVPGGNKGRSVQCVRLDALLDKYNVTTVDLWSLDVEGFEFKALSGVDWSKYHIQGLLMEQQDLAGPCAQFPIDYRLTTLGYVKYRLVSDGFYWNTRGPQPQHQQQPQQHQQQQQQPQQNPLVPNLTALDRWFRELETGRCKRLQQQLTFFTDTHN